MKMWRVCAFINVILGVVAMEVAVFIQYALEQPPCSLCIMQRFAVSGIIAVSAVALLIDPRYWIAVFFQGLSFMFAGVGIAMAGRQMYLQSLPAELKPSCGPGFDYLLQHVPFLQAMESVFKGSGECAEIQGLFLGHALPFWATVLFVIMALVSAMGMRK